MGSHSQRRSRGSRNPSYGGASSPLSRKLRAMTRLSHALVSRCPAAYRAMTRKPVRVCEFESYMPSHTVGLELLGQGEMMRACPSGVDARCLALKRVGTDPEWLIQTQYSPYRN